MNPKIFHAPSEIYIPNNFFNQVRQLQAYIVPLKVLSVSMQQLKNETLYHRVHYTKHCKRKWGKSRAQKSLSRKSHFNLFELWSSPGTELQLGKEKINSVYFFPKNAMFLIRMGASKLNELLSRVLYPK